MNGSIHERVREHYAGAAIRVLEGGSCCGAEPALGPALYAALERDALPDAAVLASLGCGHPAAVAGLYLSYWLNAASGATIVLVETAAFLVALSLGPRTGLLARLRRRATTAMVPAA